VERAVFSGFDFPVTARAALLVIDMQPRGVGAEAGLVQAIERTAPGYTRYLTARVRATVFRTRSRTWTRFTASAVPSTSPRSRARPGTAAT
jgi:hypothetical protein